LYISIYYNKPEPKEDLQRNPAVCVDFVCGVIWYPFKALSIPASNM
jgi:hypothetical protein